MEWIQNASATELSLWIPIVILFSKEMTKFIVGDRDNDLAKQGLRSGGMSLPWIAMGLLAGIALNESAAYWTEVADRSRANLALVATTASFLALAAVSVWLYKVAALDIRKAAQGRSQHIPLADGEQDRGQGRGYRPFLLVVGSYLAGWVPLGWISGQL